MGINCHHVYVIRAEYAEQAIDISDTVLRHGQCDLLVVDTLAHLIPSVEIEESSEKWQVGVQARLINKMLRKIVSAQNAPGLDDDTRPTAILLNQVRMKVGVLWGNPETRPGGMGQEFATSIDIRMWPGKYGKDKDGNTLNVVTNFRCVKNKVAPAQMDGNFRLWLRDYETRKAGDTEDKAVVLGQALKHGWLGNSKDGWVYDGNKFKTKKEILQFLLKNRDAYEELRTGLFSDMLGTIASDKEALKIEENEEADIGTVSEGETEEELLETEEE
jgi:recombination protein RecA